tara:strand:+ start:168 stop:842 length:675 start_codon:yes stop_codon:yes gene_type:complete
MRKTHWISVTKDAKTGSIPVSYSPKESCPDSCSLKEGGCYAWGLFYLRILGAKIRDGKIEIKTLGQALKERRVDAKVVRHRVAGDIVGDVPGTVEECLQVEKEGLTNIGYTHHWRAEEAQPLKKWFRASCSSLEEVELARSMGWSVTIMVPEGTPKKMMLENGETAFMCPARHGVEGKADITCNTCTLCKVTDKTADKTVMFEVHGTKGTISKASSSLVTFGDK